MKKLTLLSSLLLSLNASAALYDRGNGMIYDSTQNITWLQDANYAVTSGFAAENASSTTYGANIVHADGGMGWVAAKNWATNLVYGGYDDWRLPSARLRGNSTYSEDGSTDLGWGTRGELSVLFAELGNCAHPNTCPIVGLQVQQGFLKYTFQDAQTGRTASFLNGSAATAYWWYNEDASNVAADTAWLFINGYQGYSHLAYMEGAWAVRDGDIAAIPLPAAAWLFGSGLLGLAATARKRKFIIAMDKKAYVTRVEKECR